MNVPAGLRRIKIILALVCAVPALVLVVLLSFSQYEPALMRTFLLLALVIAASLIVPLFMPVSIKNKFFIAIVGAGCAGAIFANLNHGQDALYGDNKPAAIALFGIGLWLVWSSVEWVAKGFTSGK